MGWTGAISFVERGPWDQSSPLFVFYRLDKEGELVNIRSESLEMPRKSFFEVERAREERKQEPINTGELVPSWFDTTKTLFTKDLLPSHVNASPLAKSLLYFWITCALLRVRSGKDSDSLQQGTKSIRVRWRQMPTPKPGVYDFAVVCYDPGDSGVLYALCLCWDTGVAYRIGQVWIPERDWKGLEMVWKPVVLG